MQPVQDVEQYTTAQVFAAHLELIGKDIQAWTDLLAEDAVVEFPYFCSCLPERLEGKPAIYNYMKNVIAQMQIGYLRMFVNINPNVLFAEFHGKPCLSRQVVTISKIM